MMMGGIEGRSVATGNDLQSNPHNDKKPTAEDGLATSANVIACIRERPRYSRTIPHKATFRRPANIHPGNGIKRYLADIFRGCHLDGKGRRSPLHSFALITVIITDPERVVQPMLKRMPVIITECDCNRWLKTEPDRPLILFCTPSIQRK